MKKHHDEPFEPHRLFAGPTLQTLGAALPWWTGRVTAELVRVPIAGGALHLHLTRRGGRAPMVLLVHGIGGSSESNYVLRASSALLSAGFHVARIDLRGAGNSLADAPSLYHAGVSDDVDRAAAMVARDPMVEGVSLLGFSLGGNIVLKLAGEWGDSPPAYVRRVVALSPVVDLEPSSKALETRATFPYRVYVMRSLLSAAKSFAKRHPDKVNFSLRGLTRFSTVRDYDRQVVVPMHGFRDVSAYYESARSGPLLKDIRVPTLFAFAEDDPMIPSWTVKPWLAKASPSVDVAWSKYGGHVGWFETVSRDAFIQTWAVKRALRFLASNG